MSPLKPCELLFILWYSTIFNPSFGCHSPIKCIVLRRTSFCNFGSAVLKHACPVRQYFLSLMDLNAGANVICCHIPGLIFCCIWRCRYTAEAPEMQMRRLADLAFMFQLYELAYQIYHAAKKDFNNEHAWLHFAGAVVRCRRNIFTFVLLFGLHTYLRNYCHLFLIHIRHGF